MTLRSRQQRNLLATLLLSQGVPMLLGGDEIGRTQRGNNNGYCQDNELTWHDWEAVDEPLLEFTRRLIQFRHDHPVFHRRGWFQGRPFRRPGRPRHRVVRTERPRDDRSRLGGCLDQPAGDLPLPAGQVTAADGAPMADDSFYVAFNAGIRDRRFRLPYERLG